MDNGNKLYNNLVLFLTALWQHKSQSFVEWMTPNINEDFVLWQME